MEIVDITKVVDADFVLTLKNILKSCSDDRYKPDAKHPSYKECKDHAEEMSWHVYGTKPVRLLNRVRPREDPAITQYRIESYEPVTESVCRKALSIVHKIFDPNLYSIRFEEKSTQANELKKYTLEEYPQFNNIINYLANFLMKKMIADPNAVVLIQPYFYDLKESERVKPIATCYHSRDVFLITQDYALLFDDYKEVEKGAKQWYFTYVDKTAIYKFYVQISADGRDYEIFTTVSYAHNFDELPLWALTGDYSDSKDVGYKSYFYPAVPFWNKAINDDSDVDGSYRMHMWPQKWEVADECEYVERGETSSYACQGGWIFNAEKADKHKCPSCSGSGYKTAKSPYESHLVNRDKFLTGEGGSANIQPPFGYVTVPTDATKMLEEKAERNLQKGLVALNMDVMNEIGLNQSGKAKEMDRTELNDFLKRMATVMYDIHLTNIYYYFTKYMFGVSDPTQVDKIQPEISKPTQFDVYSSTELTEQLSKAKDAKLNPSYLASKQIEIQNKEFQTNPILLNRLNLEISLDPLAEQSTEDISLMLANGTIEQKVAIIHDNIRLFVARALEETKGFEQLERAKQWEILLGYAEETVEANKVKIDQSAIAPEEQEPEPVQGE